MDEDDWDDLVETLTEAEDHERLWRLVVHLDAPPATAAAILTALDGRGWRPGDPGGRAAFAELAPLARRCTSGPPTDASIPGAKDLDCEVGVVSVAITADGALLVTGCSDGTLRWWSLPGGELVGAATDDGGGAWAIAVSPDGRLLASCARDGMTRLWRLPSGRRVGTVDAAGYFPNTVAFTPDGALLVCGCYDGTIALRAMPDGRHHASLTGHTNSIDQVLVSPDGRYLASRAGRHLEVRLWMLPSGGRAGVLGHRAQVLDMAFSPDGRWLATGDADGTVRLWEPPSTTPTATLRTGSDHWVQAVSFSHDGALVVAGGDHGAVHLWHVPSGEPAGTLDGGAHDLAPTPDGRSLVTVPWGGPPTVWDLASRVRRGTVADTPFACHHVTMAPDGGVAVLHGTLDAAPVVLCPLGTAPTEVPLADGAGGPDAGADAWTQLVAALAGARRRSGAPASGPVDGSGAVELSEGDRALLDAAAVRTGRAPAALLGAAVAAAYGDDPDLGHHRSVIRATFGAAVRRPDGSGPPAPALAAGPAGDGGAVLVDASVLLDHLRGHAPAAVALAAHRGAGPLHAAEATRLDVLAAVPPDAAGAARALLDVFVWHPLDRAVAEGAAALAGSAGRDVGHAELVVAATVAATGTRLLTRDVRRYPMTGDRVTYAEEAATPRSDETLE